MNEAVFIALLRYAEISKRSSSAGQQTQGGIYLLNQKILFNSQEYIKALLHYTEFKRGRGRITKMLGLQNHKRIFHKNAPTELSFSLTWADQQILFRIENRRLPKYGMHTFKTHHFSTLYMLFSIINA